MVDEIYDRSYQSGRAELNEALDAGFTRMGRAIANVFAVMHRIEFDAPWRPRARSAR